MSARKQAEEGRELRAGDISHRVKNLQAIASGLTHVTSRSATTIEEMARGLTERHRLGRAHDLARPRPGNEGKAALLGDLVSVLLAPYYDQGAFAGASSTTLETVISERPASQADTSCFQQSGDLCKVLLCQIIDRAV